MDSQAKFAALARHAQELAQTVEDHWETEVKKGVRVKATYTRSAKRPKGDRGVESFFETAKLKNLDLPKDLLCIRQLMVPPGFQGAPCVSAEKATEGVAEFVAMHSACVDMVKADKLDAITESYCGAMEDVVVFLGDFAKHIVAPTDVTEDAVSKVLESAKALVANEPSARITVTVTTRAENDLMYPSVRTASAGLPPGAHVRMDTVAHKARRVPVPPCMLRSSAYSFLGPDQEVRFIGNVGGDACIVNSSGNKLHTFMEKAEWVRNGNAMQAFRYHRGGHTVVALGTQKDSGYSVQWFMDGDHTEMREKVFPGRNDAYSEANGAGIVVAPVDGLGNFSTVTFLKGRQAYTSSQDPI